MNRLRYWFKKAMRKYPVIILITLFAIIHGLIYSLVVYSVECLMDYLR